MVLGSVWVCLGLFAIHHKKKLRYGGGSGEKNTIFLCKIEPGSPVNYDYKILFGSIYWDSRRSHQGTVWLEPRRSPPRHSAGRWRDQRPGTMGGGTGGHLWDGK